MEIPKSIMERIPVRGVSWNPLIIMIKKKRTNIRRLVGIFLFMSISESLYFVKRATIPSINDVLTIALPRNVEIAISACPVYVEYALMTRSGRDVPRDIRVKPIRKLLIFIFFARAMDWSMNISENLINTISINIEIVIFCIEKIVAYISVVGNGESGIRTHGMISHTHALQACPFDHSGISP